jgi:hypothetical protein
MNWRNACFSVALIALLTACTHHEISTSELAGFYIYRYGDGHLEMLILNPDLTYHHLLYSSVSDAKTNTKPAYQFVGRWSSVGGIVTLDGWMLIADYSDFEKPRASPLRCTDFRGYWYHPGNGGSTGLLFAEDIGYNFLKIDNRDEIR